MRWGWIGGLLIIGGSFVYVNAAALAGPDGPFRVTIASLVLLGSGASVLGVFGPKPLHGRGIRIGLGALAGRTSCAFVDSFRFLAALAQW